MPAASPCVPVAAAAEGEDALEVAFRAAIKTGFPPKLVDRARAKVLGQDFDFQSTFNVKRRALLSPRSYPSPGDQRALMVTALRTMEACEDVWVVRHTWSFTFRDAMDRLRESPVDTARLGALLFRDDNASITADMVFDNLWRIAVPLAAAKNDLGDTIWAVHDELGAALTHSTTPVARMQTLVFGEAAVSLLWLGEPCMSGSVVTVDRSPALPAHNNSCDGIVGAVLYGDTNERRAAFRACEAVLSARDTGVSHAPRVDPATTEIPADRVHPPYTGRTPLRVCTDSRSVIENLTDPRFTMVRDAEDADVMWLCHYKLQRSDEFPHAKFVSQYPEEKAFVNKISLARTVQQGYGYRTWHPDTYVVPGDLAAFVAAFERRRHRVTAGLRDGEHEDDEVEDQNLWIVKAPELSRGMDMAISGNLSWLLELGTVGTRIIQVYISRPLLFRKRKFDVRYYLLLRSTRPLEAYVHKTVAIRVASEEYAPTELHRFDRHWTVSRAGSVHTSFEEFTEAFQQTQDRPNVWFAEVQPRIHTMLRELCVAIQALSLNVAARGRFRGLYAADILLTERGLQPRLLEVNYSPDNSRVLRDNPNFLNEVFATLFLGVPTNVVKL